MEAVPSYKYLGCGWITNWTGLHTGVCRPPVQEDTKQAVLPEEIAVVQYLQQTAVDVSPVCGYQRPLLHCGVLGGQHIQEGHLRTR